MTRAKSITESRSARTFILIIFVLGMISLLLLGCGEKKAGNETAASQQGGMQMSDSTMKSVAGASGQKAGGTTGRKILYWRAPMDPTYISDKPGKSPMGMDLIPVYEEEEKAPPSSTAGKKILYWRAPMDPTYISDKPGKSPMGMDLIPVYEGEEKASKSGAITIDPVVVQNIGVKTALVEVKQLTRQIRTVAHVDYDEEKIYRINIKFSGWIEKLFVDQTGQKVREGEPLLEIYSPELMATQEEYLLAYKNAQKLRSSALADISQSGESLLQATRQRLLLWDISDAQIRALEERGETFKTMTIHAPHSGVVINKMAEEGMRVVPGMDLYRIADLSHIWIYAHLFEYEIPWVKLGDEADVELSYVPGKIFKARINYIYPFLDKKTRDVKVRLELRNSEYELKPDMYANVTFSSNVMQATPVIPSEAIIRSGKRNLVFIALGEGKFAPREVVLGNEGAGNEFQVLSGLQGGESVVTSAQFLIDSESRLQEAIQKMLEAKQGRP